MPPTLKNVTRLDSLPLNQTFFTEEGFLIDRPVVTSTGIFEYTNDDGSIRRELRLPEDVFEPESLASYEGKPIIITHNAGLVDKDNVHSNSIGTILSAGYRSGDNVKAKIIIHDTNEMKKCGLKELSLGYNLDLDETAGEWNGYHYDAIQRNIRINHLALVHEARAGEKARLNIDSRDGKTLIGGKAMSKSLREDSVLSPEELAKAIEEYKARRAAEKSVEKAPVSEAEPVPVKETAEPKAEETKVEETKVEEVKTEDSQAEAQTVEAEVPPTEEKTDAEKLDDAKATIESQDADIKTLFDIIDTLLAERDFKTDAADKKDAEKSDDEDESEEAEVEEVEEDSDDAEDSDKEADAEEEAETNEDADDTEEADEDKTEDADEEVEEAEVVEEEEPEEVVEEEVEEEEKTDSKKDSKKDSKDCKADCKTMNADSMDAIIKERVHLGMIGRELNMDGLEDMNPVEAKKMVIGAIRPSVNMDGKSPAYINAMFDLAYDDVKARNRKDTNYQKKQMFNKDSKQPVENVSSAEAARQRMIERRNGKREE